MSLSVLLTTAIRWVGLSALAGLIGGLVIDIVVVPQELPNLAALRKRLRRWGLVCTLIVALTTAGELVIRAQTMAGGDLMAAIKAAPTVLLRTHFGSLWIARFLALGVSVLVAFRASRAARMLALVLAIGVALTTSLTGHAGDWGDVSLSAGVDWVHVVASATWAGGLLCLVFVVQDSTGAWDAAAIGTVARRFSRLAGWCLLAVVASGSYNAWVQVPSVSALWTTAYGRTLSVKLLFVLTLVWWGAVNRYAVLPYLASTRPAGLWARAFRLGRLVIFGPRRVPRSEMPSRFRAYVCREAVLAIVVFGCTAVLVDLTPARHAGHARHDLAAQQGPIRMTMAELHASGGMPKGWSFAPPSGDSKRGHDVFVRLECFACHNVSGEAFPPPSRPGPDLTDVGEHHPAGYLTESIMNPNAVIVEGRGYTGPDGRSIMPDYRDSLSLGDLIDLVAYLKSLGGSDR